ncbi:hypothetical protein E2986_11301 [Frieseomelitta varia]|uniref:Mediator of RNA polymerase II transcription subunit 20 n=1 Tax=Frieseomelitta varia TaxID=561572 RepID=A0A833S486_9HYME|nr:hypothetical protein E2986_11301 [Frieseomelitta varia]
MYKMSSVYTNKMQKIESKGPRFEIGDFCVKLGSVTINQNFKGVLVEVEYRPCVVPGSAWELMREFLQGFLGSTVSNQAPQYLQFQNLFISIIFNLRHHFFVYSCLLRHFILIYF